jgi:hypothetical protein
VKAAAAELYALMHCLLLRREVDRDTYILACGKFISGST